MLTLLGVILGGSLGTAARYGVAQYAERLSPQASPYATFAVNVAGCLLLGLIVATHADGRMRAAATIGFLGAFTTFSTLAFQTYNALDADSYAHAFMLPAATVIAGVVAVYAGIVLGERVLPSP